VILRAKIFVLFIYFTSFLASYVDEKKTIYISH